MNEQNLVLTDVELKEHIQKGFLSEIFLHPEYKINKFKHEVLFDNYYENNIKYFFNFEWTSKDAIFITDFYLIIVNKKVREIIYHDFVVNVIPLEKVKSIQLTERSEYVPGSSYEVKKDPAKGALVGALLAGTTGAVVGAAMNSGTKTVNTGGSNLYYTDICIKFENGKMYKLEEVESSLHSMIDTPYGINYKNENISFLIKRAKENLPENVKREIVRKNSTPKGCYVATCVYGSYDCPEVWVLRRFRDNYLEKYILGKLLINCYYSISPTIVKLFGKFILFKKANKFILDKLVKILRKKGYTDTKYNDKY